MTDSPRCHDVEPEVTDNDWVPYIRYRLRHFAPPLQNHQSRDTKSREKQLMMHRWKLYTEYLLSYGEGKDALTAEQAEIVAEIIQRVSHMIPKGIERFPSFSAYCPDRPLQTLSPSEAAPTLQASPLTVVTKYLRTWKVVTSQVNRMTGQDDSMAFTATGIETCL